MLRTRQRLLALDDLKTFCQYLYLDPTHQIQIVNAIGVTLTITMTDNYGFLVTNENFPELSPHPFTNEMTIPAILDMIEQLKTAPAILYPDQFSNRWKEIETITNMNLALNH